VTNGMARCVLLRRPAFSSNTESHEEDKMTATAHISSAALVLHRRRSRARCSIVADGKEFRPAEKKPF